METDENLLLGVSATRDGMTRLQAETACMVLSILFDKGARWLAHGDCQGGDEQLATFWRSHLGGKLERHPPTNPVLRAFVESDVTLAPLPYLQRNDVIARRSRHLVAAPKNMSGKGGTWYTIRAADRLGKPVSIIKPDGSVQRLNGLHIDA